MVFANLSFSIRTSKLTCRTWGDDEYPDSSFHLTHEDFKVKAWDKMMKMREGEDETVEEPPFSINIENLTSLANFHFIFNHPEYALLSLFTVLHALCIPGN